MNAGTSIIIGRKREIDILKGLLTVTMILCHSIQFFGEEQNMVQGLLVNFINLATFPGFVFCFGYAGNLAYFQGDWGKGVNKMGKNALRILMAFYISGIAYVALVEDKIFRVDFIMEVLLLRKYPGWSEFLASFAAMLLVGILFFPLFRKMNGKILACMALVSGLACFIPYDLVGNSWLALFVGSGHYVTFPVVQYGIFFAAGIWLCRKKIRWDWRLFAVCVCLAMPCLYFYVMTGYMPQRFPLSVWYLCGGGLLVYLYYLLSCRAERAQFILVKQIAAWLERIGADSLYYLLFSNLLIFALDSSHFSFRSVWYAYIYFIIILLVISYFKHISFHGKS